jgi:hypothetical protein
MELKQVEVVTMAVFWSRPDCPREKRSQPLGLEELVMIGPIRMYDKCRVLAVFVQATVVIPEEEDECWPWPSRYTKFSSLKFLVKILAIWPPRLGDMDFKSEYPGNGLDMFSIAYIVVIKCLSGRK